MIQKIFLTGLSALALSLPAAVEAVSMYSNPSYNSINMRMRSQQMQQQQRNQAQRLMDQNRNFQMQNRSRY
ncbi:hypothetical protein PMIT1327_01939 [Prochlorococcus marinus str. MIT 1327]|nr:hypothetical protein PMIT1312_02692 [Prochlorococcus marinus str. MIT 1312]KZR79876.1 hypothetical protein PMIT1327_01939 [Prochlorococcus marinus str. MIT 1327]